MERYRFTFYNIMEAMPLFCHQYSALIARQTGENY